MVKHIIFLAVVGAILIMGYIINDINYITHDKETPCKTGIPPDTAIQWAKDIYKNMEH